MMSKAYSDVGDIIGSFALPKGKTISAIQKVISITTDKKSLGHSEDLLTNLSKIKKTYLEVADKTKDVLKDTLNEAEKNYTEIKHHLIMVNEFFETLNFLFDHAENEVCIDDEIMKSLISNMNLAKFELEYLSDFLECAMGVLKSKEAIATNFAYKYTYEPGSGFLKII